MHRAIMRVVRSFLTSALAALLMVFLLSACGLGGGGGASGNVIGDLIGSRSATHPSSRGFIWPVAGRIVNPFGARFGRLHEGIDIGSPYGTPIHAAVSGKVSYTGWIDGYGNFTLIDVGHGLQTVYSHQSRIAVTVGQQVTRGKVIGYVGCSGFCVTPNVHFEIRLQGLAVDPMPYLS